MKCPLCHKEVAATDPEMPFCSERCRLLDLANWSSEAYVISTPAESGPGTPPGGGEEEDEN